AAVQVALAPEDAVRLARLRAHRLPHRRRHEQERLQRPVEELQGLLGLREALDLAATVEDQARLVIGVAADADVAVEPAHVRRAARPRRRGGGAPCPGPRAPPPRAPRPPPTAPPKPPPPPPPPPRRWRRPAHAAASAPASGTAPRNAQRSSPGSTRPRRARNST